MTQQGILPLASKGSGAKWLNSPITFYKGALGEMRVKVPEFERRSFALAKPSNPKRPQITRFKYLHR
jgi:hypothetical protein